MKRRLTILAAVFLTVLCTSITLKVWADNPEAETPDAPASDRFLGHVTTDKPIYKSGEYVYVRTVLLDAVTHCPVAGNTGYCAYVVSGPKGEHVAGGNGTIADSVSGFRWLVPAGQAGGQYKITATAPLAGIAPAERAFEVRAYRAPRLKTQIEFVRDGYGPGDAVAAVLEVSRAEGGLPAGAAVDVIATVDSVEVFRGASTIDDSGHCEARFELPPRIATGDGTLAFVIRDGGVVETAVKTIPILLQTVDLKIYPEGGELVADLHSYIYLEARTPSRKPADISGTVMDGAENPVATFRTVHEGRGRFAFTPTKGESYYLRIDEPSGIARKFEMPAIADHGVTVHAADRVYNYHWPVVVDVASSADRQVTVTLKKRDLQLDVVQADVGRLGREVRLNVPENVDGVLSVTVWDREGRALAERLVFRQPKHDLKVVIEADRERYVPGGDVALKVRTTNADGDPVSAVVGVTVTDDSVLELIEKREQAPRLSVMVLLENDVNELADAHVYLDAGNPDAPRAVDLLLGTQGWRRFHQVDVATFLKTHGDKAKRVLAHRDQVAVPGSVGGVASVMVQNLRVMDFADGFDDGAPEDFAKKGAVRFDMPKNILAPAGPPPPAAAPVLEAEGREEAQARAPARQIAVLGEVAKLERVADELFLDADLEGDFGEARDKAMRWNNEGGRRKRRGWGHGPMITVREYAHPARPNRQPNERVDFTETLYWHAGVKTDPNTGEATVSFALNDAVTSFKVLADGFTSDGAIAAGTAQVESVRPFYIEPKLPLEVTAGDQIRLPIAVVNGTDNALTGVQLAVTASPRIRIEQLTALDVPADTRGRQIIEFAVDGADDIALTVSGDAAGYADSVSRGIKVAPRGFPVRISQGGTIAANDVYSVPITIPDQLVPNSVTTVISVYPAPLANLTEALSALLREPNGCFEQTSSSNYPVIMAQQYFKTHSGVDPKLIARGRDLLDKGYKRLTSFECKSSGYEWFGQEPAHEALSAYGLFEFNDMAAVYPVDMKMVERTRDWVMQARDGEGGFKRERRALHTWIADRDCSDAYITWSLLEAGGEPEKLAKEIDSILKRAEISKNSYVTALGANIAIAAGRDGSRLLDKLAAAQLDHGVVGGAVTTIVGSSGVSLNVETTALAVVAWLHNDKYTDNVERGIRWISNSCNMGAYGSTQSTVLALRAILAYDAARSSDKSDGTITLFVDGRRCGTPVTIAADAQEVVQLTDVGELMEPGDHTIELRLQDGSSMPCSIAVNFNTDVPDSSAECALAIRAGLTHTEATEGEVVNAKIAVTNLRDEPVPSPIAIIGIPGGMEVRHDQLKELVKANRIAAYEVIGRDVVLYWRSMAAKATVAIPIDLVAAIPGRYTGPASRAYLYYGNEHKHWIEPLQIDIAPRG